MSNVIKGIGVSSGIAIAKAHVIKKHAPCVAKQLASDSRKEIDTLNQAIQKSRLQLSEIYAQGVKHAGKDADIILVQQEFLDDEAFLNRIKDTIASEKCNAEYAVQAACEYYETLFSNIDDEYLRERASDVRDLSDRIISNILLNEDIDITFGSQVIVFASELTPSQTLKLDKNNVLGFVTELGTNTSHVSILAKSMGIPAIVGAQEICAAVGPGQRVAIDGELGEVYLSPNEDTMDLLEKREIQCVEKEAHLQKYKGQKTVTADGKSVMLFGNIGCYSDAKVVLQNDGEGIGLFRTEFLYIDRDMLPTEDEQFNEYKKVLQAMGVKPVIVRTVDIGGDKSIPSLELVSEDNPFLGCRGIRLCMKEPAMFKTQLRALLRASIYGNLLIMFPMISTVKEVYWAKELLEQAKSELTRENITYDRDIKLGIMIETPAAVMISHHLAKEVDFFSIGTNDLIQYTMAADRNNQSISYLTDAFDPAVLSMIKHTIDNAHEHGIWVGVCGEMAGDPDVIPMLIGLGADELSVSSNQILYARERIASINALDMQKKALKSLEKPTKESSKRTFYN